MTNTAYSCLVTQPIEHVNRSGPYAERLFNGTQLFGKVIRVRYKGTQKFDQNQYHDLYEKLLEKLVVDNPDKYAGLSSAGVRTVVFV